MQYSKSNLKKTNVFSELVKDPSDNLWKAIRTSPYKLHTGKNSNTIFRPSIINYTRCLSFSLASKYSQIKPLIELFL